MSAGATISVNDAAAFKRSGGSCALWTTRPARRLRANVLRKRQQTLCTGACAGGGRFAGTERTVQPDLRGLYDLVWICEGVAGKSADGLGAGTPTLIPIPTSEFRAGDKAQEFAALVRAAGRDIWIADAGLEEALTLVLETLETGWTRV